MKQEELESQLSTLYEHIESLIDNVKELTEETEEYKKELKEYKKMFPVLYIERVRVKNPEMYKKLKEKGFIEEEK